MFQRFHAMREQREGGFTLIELLVVIIIIAILAAIAIPVFLKQREKGWRAQSESAAKNAATALESYGTENNGDYSGAADGGGNGGDLTAQGFSPVDGVTVTIVGGFTDTDEYCLQADHDQAAIPNIFYDSDVGKPDTPACTLN